ncbi:MAG: TraB/GumN family protein [Acidobacteriota bacterium]
MRWLVRSATMAALAASTVLLTAQAPVRTFLWAIEAPSAPPTYLMGSLHVLTPDYYPLPSSVERAFAESRVLIQEVDFDELTSPATMAALMQQALLVDGRTLDQLIARDLYARVTARAARAGVPMVAIQRMKPWMAAVSLTAPALKAEGFNPEHGVDLYFFTKAKKVGMERRALETAAYQFERLDQMPPAVQEALLESVIVDLDTQLKNVKTIADAWARGDTEAVERLLHSAFADSPTLYERLLMERNRNWVEPVERCLSEKTGCFIVVGAAHLVGPGSLVELLTKRGHLVRQQ